MSNESRLVELRPDKLLLDPSFGGYKLSLDSIPVYRKTIDSGVKVVQPDDDQYSFYHVKIFSLHNHLYVNPYEPNNVYFIDKNWEVFKVTSSPPHQVISLRKVFQIPNTQHQLAGSYNASIVFATSSLAVLSDGRGTLYLANVNVLESGEHWEVLYSDISPGEGVSYVLCDARIELTDNKRILNIILLFVEEKKEDKKDVKGSLFHTTLEWCKIVEEGNAWHKKCNKQLCINGSVDYVALEPGCKSIYVISDKSAEWVYDSERPIQSNPVVEMEMEQPEQKLYTWRQTEEEIIIRLPLLEQITKSDLAVSVDDLQLEVKIKGKTIISGQFFHRVSKDLTTWTLEKDYIEIELTKQETGLMWKALIPGDNSGEESLDPELVKSVHDKLAHLCSDKQETGSAVSFNSQQLEECDTVSCDSTSLFRINGENHVTTHEVSLSSLQWLFKISCEPSEAPAICVRHDLDACVWQFSQSKDENTWPHKHVGTFFAIGYVQASKTQKKFISSPPNLSYVAICEASHHIYIYRQPSPLNSELKNRFTGKKVDRISKQQLVNLETKDQILGVHATNDLLFLLLENSVCVLVINV